MRGQSQHATRSAYSIHELQCSECGEPVTSLELCHRCGATGRARVRIRVVDAELKVHSPVPPSDVRQSDLVILVTAVIDEEISGIYGLVGTTALKLEAKHTGRRTVADRYLTALTPELREQLAGPGGFERIVGVAVPTGRIEGGQMTYEFQAGAAGLTPQEARAIELEQRNGLTAKEIAPLMDRMKLNRRQMAMFKTGQALPALSVDTVERYLERAHDKLRAYAVRLRQGAVVA